MDEERVALDGDRALRRPVDDPRFQRIRRKLVEAVLDLGARRPAEQITVSELTEHAGVSRTTFYKHAESPASLLADHLIEELRPLVDPIASLLEHPGPGYLMQWRDIHLDLLHHVSENGAVYEQVFAGPGQSVVLSMISSYFGTVFDAYVQEFTRHIEGPVPSDLWVTMASIQQVNNTIAMLSAWLRTGMSTDPDVVVATYVSLVPPWQVARFSESGQTTLKTAPEQRPLEIMGLLDEHGIPADSPTAGLLASLQPRERTVLGTAQQLD